MGPTLGANFCHGLYLSLLGDGLSTGPTVLWMENTETVDVVLVGRFIYKEYIWGNSKNKLYNRKDTDKRLGKGLYNKQEQS